MTTVSIGREGGKIMRIKCDGHTNFGAHGEDIVCAALSSIVQTAALGLMQVAGIAISIKRDDLKGFLEFSLPELTSTKRYAADMILETMLCGIADLYEGYSDFIELEAK